MNNVLDYLKYQARNNPSKTAFADEKNSVTFKGLLDAAGIIGTNLAKIDCIRKPVPVMMDKDVLTIEIMLGIIQAGGFYVILDPAQPVIRLNQIIDTLAPDVLITAEEHLEYASSLDFSGKILLAEELVHGEADNLLL